MPIFEPLGFGLGLRSVHYPDIIQTHPEIDWFEIITEDYLVPGGNPLYYLDQISQHYPLVMHGVSLSIGSCDPLNWDYLKKVKQLAERIQACWISDHLCWTGVDGINMHDLLPLPYTEEAIEHTAQKIIQVQDYLGRQILIENVSSYITYQASQISEWEFLSAVAERADCLILLDINNIFVSAYNHHFSVDDYLYGIPKKRVQQFHLAGHTNKGTHIIDTHDEPIIDEVWKLYAQAIKYFGPSVSTLIERDDNIPSFKELESELNYARKIAATVQHDSELFV
jgi:uncharacterized protein (UPF0276 family)